jgi:hypothetical protein
MRTIVGIRAASLPFISIAASQNMSSITTIHTASEAPSRAAVHSNRNVDMTARPTRSPQTVSICTGTTKVIFSPLNVELLKALSSGKGRIRVQIAVDRERWLNIEREDLSLQS